MTQTQTVMPVQADSSTCSQSRPQFEVELNQLDLQNMLPFVSLKDVGEMNKTVMSFTLSVNLMIYYSARKKGETIRYWEEKEKQCPK